MRSALDTVLVTTDPQIIDIVESTAAASAVPIHRCAGLAEVGESPGVVVLGVDVAEQAALAGWSRAGAVVVGFDAATVARWSCPLGARVVVLPEGARELAGVLSGSAAETARVIAVVGGAGGVGTSTLAVGLAQQASRRGIPTALVDADPGSGGLDLLLGAERLPGWRWPALAAASGRLGAIDQDVVDVAGLALLSAAREPRVGIPAAAVAASLASLARSRKLVLVDVGRGDTAMAQAALSSCAGALVLLDTRVAAVAATKAVLAGLPIPTRIVLQRSRQAPLSTAEVAYSLGADVWVIPRDHEIARGAEQGIAPDDCAGRAWRKAVATVLDVVEPRHG